MKSYEVMLAISPDLEQEELDSFLEKYKKLIQEKKGVIVKIDKWGKKDLAYEIKKFQQANYVVISFDLDGQQILELERIMRLDDQIIRYLLVARQEKILPVQEKPPKLIKKEKKPEPEPGEEKPKKVEENKQEE